jgi:YggT family protein
MLIALFDIVDFLLNILVWIIIIQVILSWLFAFNVLNTGSAGLRTFVDALDRLTAPLYKPIRAVMPDFGGIDFSPLVLILVIKIVQMLLNGAERSLVYSAI